MELRVLEYFLAVAREQSISGAAEYLHLTQPTLSRQLRELEEELGCTLLVRGKRGQRTALTPEGRAVPAAGPGDPGSGLQGGTGGTAVGEGNHRRCDDRRRRNRFHAGDRRLTSASAGRTPESASMW